MDIKNVIAAISLSAAVIILYSLFFQQPPEPSKIKKNVVEKTEVIEDSEAPALDQNENFSKLTRKEALNENEANIRIDEICEKLLHNPIIEKYSFNKI